MFTSCRILLFGFGLFVLLLVQNNPTVAQSRPEPAAAPRQAVSDAERIANTRKEMKDSQEAIEQLQARLDNPKGEFPRAEAEFQMLDTKVKDTIAEIAKLKGEEKLEEAKKLEDSLPKLQEELQAARERLDLAFRQRRATQEAIASLQERILKDQKLLDRLEGNAPADPPPNGNGNKQQQQPVAKETDKEAKAAEEEPKDEGFDLIGSIAAGMGVPMPKLDGAEDKKVAGVEITAMEMDLTDPVIRKAFDQLEVNRSILKEAEARLRGAEERARSLDRSLRSAQDMLNIETEAKSQTERSIARMKENLLKLKEDETKERGELVNRIKEAETNLSEIVERIGNLQNILVRVNLDVKAAAEEKEIAQKDVESAQNSMTSAEEQLNYLIHPLAPRNVIRWTLRQGPIIVCIIAGMVILHLVVRQFARQIVNLIMRNNSRGSPEDRENRASTLIGVLRYAAAIFIYGGGTVMLLDQLGIPVVPLMGGAAVLGLAVAFGAQNMIRDYFTGFMILMEDQYSVNDVVKVGDISGLVEKITLRTTVLRDLEGTRHFIPHGTVTTVSNMTHCWSRALFDIEVSYKENIDQVIAVLLDLGREMRNDPALGHYILEDPEMLGVDALGSSGVLIKFIIKTKPLRQWPIKRELLKRIKNRFDQLGIKIPHPHRTLYHYNAEENLAQLLPNNQSTRVREAAWAE